MSCRMLQQSKGVVQGAGVGLHGRRAMLEGTEDS